MLSAEQKNLIEILNEASECLDKFRVMLRDASKAESESDIDPIVLTFSPEEWEQIAFTIRHYQHFWNEYHKRKDYDDKTKWIVENAGFIALVRDLACSWYSRLEGGNKKAEA